MTATRLVTVLAGVCIAALLASRTSQLTDREAAPAHVHPAGEHHEHGDGDDRHDSPDSPCHHHDDHCNCSAPSDSAMMAAHHVAPAASARGGIAPTGADGGPLEALPTDIFHPPLA